MTEALIHNIEEEKAVRIDKFIENFAPAAVFHKSVFFRLYSKTPGYKPVYFIEYADGKIVGIMLAVRIRSYLISPFGSRGLVIGLPVIDPEYDWKAKDLFYAYKNIFGKNVFYSEIRNVDSADLFSDALKSAGFYLQKRVNLVIDFGLSDTFQKLSESKQRQINKGLEGGATIDEFKNVDEVRTFYNILKGLYRKKVKKPLPPFEFFKMAWRYSRNIDEIQMIAVKFSHIVIGGMLMVGAKGHVCYEWYIGGLHNDYKELYPSVMATWGGIQKAQKYSAKRFDFMGGGVAEESYGVREFKARFGSDKKESYRWYFTRYPKILALARKFIVKLKI